MNETPTGYGPDRNGRAVTCRRSRSLGAGLTALALLAGAAAVFATPGAEAATKAKAKAKTPALLKPNGAAPPTAGTFLWSGATVGGYGAAASAGAAFAQLPQKNGLFTLLIIGSDARPGESVLKTRGDSIHLLVYNVARQKGTLIGFPRDSYVPIAGHGKAKITSALAWGGPTLMTSTVAAVTGIPVSNYVVTGFAGFTALIDAVGGVNVLVDPQMNDRFSGATFAKGWFSMNGNAALAFNRDRHDVANGDFGRSANQAKFLLSALTQMRARTADSRGLLTWVSAVRANTTTNLPLKDLLVFAQVARSVNPVSLTSVIVPGTNSYVKAGKSRQAVVLLKSTAPALFADIGTDGIRGK